MSDTPDDASVTPDDPDNQWNGTDWIEPRGIAIKITNSINDALIFTKHGEGGLLITFWHNDGVNRHQFVADDKAEADQFVRGLWAL